jgi:transitional endoplasmic reticulum ATPase
LQREVARVREIVELPLKHPRIFERLGILAPKGVLLYGPPGTGKTLLARAVAAESRVHFIHLNGPEIMRKFYGESEAKLREVFEDAARHAPAILFIDEIDAVAPKRAEVVGEVEKRVVAQLLSLMDGFVSRGQVIVIGATNIPEVLDPALRRPGRFDREIEIGVPNNQARLQILKIHTRSMPLADDVNLQEIAEHSHGFVGADLEALCQEVGMIALRGFLAAVPLETDGTVSPELGALQVTRDDFVAGLKEVEPSATREFFIEKSSTTFANLGGLSEVKRLLDAVFEHSHMHDEIYEQVGLAPPRGILLSDRRAREKPRWRERFPAKSRFHSSLSMAHSCTRNGWANPSGRCEKFSKKPDAPRRASCSSTPSMRSRLNLAPIRWARTPTKEFSVSF